MLCAKRGNETCTLYEEKSPVRIQTLRTYAGIGDAETQSPGMLRKPGDLPYMCPRPKKFKRLATRDTLHESRPNLRQREPDGRIVPTPPDVSDKGASTKRCAQRKKKITIIHTHIRHDMPSRRSPRPWGLSPRALNTSKGGRLCTNTAHVHLVSTRK